MSNKILFLHIPKTAGSSFNSILYDLFPGQNRFYVTAGSVTSASEFYHSTQRIVEGLDDRIVSNVGLIYGHFPFPKSKVYQDFEFLTFIRNPIDRVISDFNYVRSTPRNPLYHIANNLDLKDYVSSSSNLHLDNLQTRLISGKIVGTVGESELELALNNLFLNFKAYGITENFDDSLYLFRNTLDWNSKSPSRVLNATSKKIAPSKEQISNIEMHNSLDLQLYDYAKVEFQNRVKMALQKEGNLGTRLKPATIQTGPKDRSEVFQPIRTIFMKPIRAFLKGLGFDLVKVNKHRSKKKKRKSVRTDRLTFHETKTGKYYLPTDAPTDGIANAIIQNRIFEKDVVELASKHIVPGTAVLDVGSNFGQMSVLFAGMTGRNGKVFAFEANKWVYEILKKNIVANSLHDVVHPHFGAVHSKAGEILHFPEPDFERFGTYGSYGIDYKSNKGDGVTSISIDSLEIEIPISFMKIDIQGGDLFALQGAVQTIAKHQMPILFEYEYIFEDELGYTFQEYVDFVRDIGYRFRKVVNGHNFLICPAQ